MCARACLEFAPPSNLAIMHILTRLVTTVVHVMSHGTELHVSTVCCNSRIVVDIHVLGGGRVALSILVGPAEWWSGTATADWCGQNTASSYFIS